MASTFLRKIPKLLLLLTLILHSSTANYYKEYTIDNANISATASSNILPEREDPGTCECDLTSNSCDAYWCCDWDWSQLRSTWKKNNLCRDEPEEVALPLNDCISGDNIRTYNKERGEYSYAGPLTRLFCIYFNNHPPSNKFFETKIAVTNDEVNDLNTNDVTFGTKLFTIEAAATNDYYSIGDPLFALYDGQVNTRNFRLPKPLFSGAWDFDAPAAYLTNEDVTWMGEITFTNAGCTGANFNPQYYYKGNLNLITNPQISSSTVDVTSTTYYTVNANGVYTATNGAAPASTFTTNANWGNILKEAIYTFKYIARNDGFLIPQSVDVILVLYETLTFTADGETASVPMKFQTFYELVNSNVTEITYRSGNSGYLDREPLLVGTLNANGGIDSSKDGYMIEISTTTWRTSTDLTNTLTTTADNLLRFNQNMTVSCYVQATGSDAATFQTLWAATTRGNLAIFNQLTSFQRVGKYGNANVNFPSDWLTAIDQDLDYTTSTYNATAQTCRLLTEVSVEFLTSKRGSPENQHSYIISARKKGITRTITFDEFKAQNSIINLQVSYEYTRVTEREASLSSKKTKVAYEWSSDILWPFGEFDGAYSSAISAILATGVIILGMEIF